jgi:hypothetical protein
LNDQLRQSLAGRGPVRAARRNGHHLRDRVPVGPQVFAFDPCSLGAPAINGEDVKAAEHSGAVLIEPCILLGDEPDFGFAVWLQSTTSAVATSVSPARKGPGKRIFS